MTTTKVPVELSSTPGIVDNSNATAITIDSSENVIVGSSTANDSSSVTLRADGTAHVNNAQFSNGNGSAGGTTPAIYSPASATLAISTNSAERLRLDGSGNFGIGESNPSSYGTLAVTGTGAVGNFNASSGAATVQLYENGAGRFGITTPNGSAGANFTVAGSTKLTIDSSGNLLVGRTSVGSTGAGHSIRGADSAIFSRSGGEALIINRDSSNGKLIELRKDGTELANIQVLNNNNLAIMGSVADHGGIQFATHSMVPMEAGVDADGTVDLGSSSARWKDLYLSGGVYLGGTAAGNHLYDYEEGTFTLTFINSAGDMTATNLAFNASGRFLKVGQLVHIQGVTATSGTLGGTSTSAVKLIGLPFTASVNTYIKMFVDDSPSYNKPSAAPHSLELLSGTSQGRVKKLSGHEVNLAQSELAQSGNGNRFFFSGTYVTDS